ncbi:hypothetical protein BCR32DRAFT_290492 [Anaeromyces robustus]|uniref:GSKIP domain-containing protein n=1 Tax=Anaeromyces robustus TaxID=1754192 RepID=A0A1Y1XIX1_9FUNG|nr:hypothetical protein BCR32DRAFT_290492 [Anaeromyces robustus]|eukprot:ORX85707.1 hypothetical protein BCR32DRAFT_290492 [Anaeromyces robustus]
MRQEAVYEELEYLDKIRYGLKPNSEIYIKKDKNNNIFNYISDDSRVGTLNDGITTSILKDNTNFITLNELIQSKEKKNGKEVKFVIFKCCVIENVWIVVKLSDNGYTIIDAFSEKSTSNNFNDFDFNYFQNREAETDIYKYINFSFETMENLLQTTSSGFRMQFKDSLFNKLQIEFENRKEEENEILN